MTERARLHPQVELDMLEYERREGLVDEKKAVEQERLIRGYAEAHGIKLKKVKRWARPSELTEHARRALKLDDRLPARIFSAKDRKRIEHFIKAEENKVARYIRLTTVVLDHGKATRLSRAVGHAQVVYRLIDKYADSGARVRRKTIQTELSKAHKITLSLRQIDRILKKRPVP